MKIEEAKSIINKVEGNGYMVTFERAEKGLLYSDHFPDKHAGEELIPTRGEAWTMAAQFAENTKGKYVNIYVVDSGFMPVNGYKDNIILNS